MISPPPPDHWQNSNFLPWPIDEIRNFFSMTGEIHKFFQWTIDIIYDFFLCDWQKLINFKIFFHDRICDFISMTNWRNAQSLPPLTNDWRHLQYFCIRLIKIAIIFWHLNGDICIFLMISSFWENINGNNESGPKFFGKKCCWCSLAYVVNRGVKLLSSERKTCLI